MPLTARRRFQAYVAHRLVRVINTNLNSVFNVTRQVIEGMMERGWGRSSTFHR